MKKTALFLFGIFTFLGIGLGASNYSFAQNPESVQQNLAPCYTDTVCDPAPCFTDTVCNPAPCFTDTVCNPAPCIQAPATPAPVNVCC